MSTSRWIATLFVLAALCRPPPVIAQTPPRPEAASGIVVEREPRPRRTALRAVLFLPRVVIAAVLAPVRLAYWTDDRYHVVARLDALLWNDARTIGVYPVASWDGSRSLSGGGVFVDRALGGAGLTVRVTAGTNDRVVVEPTLSTRALLGPLRFEVGGRYREVLAASFYGYGNGDEAAAPPMERIDPLVSDVAVDSRFQMSEAMARASARWHAARWLAVKTGASVRRLTFGAPSSMFGDDGVGLAEAYDPARVPGFAGGVEALRAELAVRVDRRRNRDATQSRAVPSTGAAAELYGGWDVGLGGDDHAFAYGGLDVIGHLDVYGGDRVVSLRAVIDTVTGDLDQIPFVSLPTLGGDTLRGYVSSRFRDRWTAALALEYTWPVTRGVAAFAFADAGRAARRVDELIDDPVRAGTGIGLQVHGQRALGARVWLAVSREGAVLANLRLDTSFASRPREVPR